MDKEVSNLLVQLSINSNIDTIFYSSNLNKKKCSSNNNIEIEEYDANILECLIIPAYIDLKDIISLDIIVDNYMKIIIPFDLLINFTKIEIINNNYYISINNNILGICSNKLFNYKYFLLYRYIKPLTINLKTNNNIIFDYNLLYYSIFFSANFLSKYIRNHSISYIYYNYDKYMINKTTTIYNCNYICSGFFITTNDIITNFNVNIYDCKILSIDEDIIYYKKYLLPKNNIDLSNDKIKSLKLSLQNNLPNDIILEIIKYLSCSKYKYLYFFPLGISGNINNGINLNKVEQMNINITTKNNIYDGVMYLKNRTCFNYLFY